MFCIMCGARAMAGAAFCGRCGAKLPDSAAASAEMSAPDVQTVGKAAGSAIKSPTETHETVGGPSAPQKPLSRGWYHMPGDPERVQRWFDGTHWTGDITGGSAEDRASAKRIVTPGTGAMAGEQRSWRLPPASAAGGGATFAGRLEAFSASGAAAEPMAYRSQRSKPGQLVAGAVLMFIFGGLAVLGGVILLTFGRIAGVLVPIGLLELVGGGLAIWSGVGLLNFQAWARVMALSIVAVNAVLGVISLVNGVTAGLLSLAFDVAVLAVLQHERVSAVLK